MRLSTVYRLFSIALLGSLLTACAPNPRAKLTDAQRRADMEWLLTKIETNYAPLHYKEDLYKFKYADLRAKYIDDALKDQSNEEFYRLMFKLIAEFKDAHFSASLTRSPLPGRSTVTYLGFSGFRKGEAYKVEKFLDTFTDVSSYPVKVGDEILEINGRKLRDAVKEDLTPMRNVGNDDTNFTYLVSSLFTRSSMNYPVTVEGSVSLKLKRDDKVITVDVPWITKDYVAFTKEQSEAALKKAKDKGADFSKDTAEFTELLQGIALHPFMTEGKIQNLVRNSTTAQELIDNVAKTSATLTPLDTFEFKQLDPISEVTEFYSILGQKFAGPVPALPGTPAAPPAPETKLESLKKVRYVPEKVFMIEAAETYPSYIAVIEKDKKRTSVGYILLNTFSPAHSEADVLKEFKKTLIAFRDYGEKGVDKVVIDMLNNGGGSLSLGMKLAQLLSPEKVNMPTMKVRLNDNWVDSFENGSLAAGNDARAEISRANFSQLLKALQNGEALSAPISADAIIPMELVANTDLAIFDQPFKFKVSILVNEMCASMCDIFSSIMKDNKLATLIGKQTMGAGGNVVQHAAAPNSGLQVNITESLVIGPNGAYIENNGIKPDVEVEVTNSRDKKYEEVIKKGIEI